jgi:hypothetical protein
MESDITSLRRRTGELIVSVGRLLELLRDAKFEAAQPRNIANIKGAEHWSNQAIENISTGLEKTQSALEQKNPVNLAHVAGEFAMLGRYVDDYDYSWFSKRAELDQVLGVVCKAGASIHISIDTFDPENLEVARKALG